MNLITILIVLIACTIGFINGIKNKRPDLIASFKAGFKHGLAKWWGKR